MIKLILGGYKTIKQKNHRQCHGKIIVDGHFFVFGCPKSRLMFGKRKFSLTQRNLIFILTTWPTSCDTRPGHVTKRSIHTQGSAISFICSLPLICLNFRGKTLLLSAFIHILRSSIFFSSIKPADFSNLKHIWLRTFARQFRKFLLVALQHHQSQVILSYFYKLS